MKKIVYRLVGRMMRVKGLRHVAFRLGKVLAKYDLYVARTKMDKSDKTGFYYDLETQFA